MFDIHNVFDESKMNNFSQNGIASVFTIRAELSLCGNTKWLQKKLLIAWLIIIHKYFYNINKRIIIMWCFDFLKSVILGKQKYYKQNR